jgi:phosphatidylinositol-bisphosphatase
VGAEDRGTLKVVSQQLVGILIVVYVLKSERRHVSNVAVDSVPTGLLGIACALSPPRTSRVFIYLSVDSGNKGGTAIRLCYQGSTITFVNTHLAAHAHMLDRRNLDFHEISQRLTFPRPLLDPPLVHEHDPDADHGSTGIYDGHLMFWFGDLNYRIELPAAQVKAHVENKNWAALWPHDQVRSSLDIA